MKIRKVESNFTQVSNNPLNDKRLSWKAKGIFAYLYSKPDDWDFSSDRMKYDSSDGRESLLAGLKELEVNGYLIRKKLPSGKVEYTLDYNPKSEKPIQASEPKSENPTMGKSLHGKTRPISNTERTNNTEADTKIKDAVYTDERFHNVWTLYPRKTGKGGAWKSWQKLKVTNEMYLKMCRSIELYSKTPQWKKDNGQFIPHLATFLNQRRFDDEVEESVSGSKITSKYAGL